MLEASPPHATVRALIRTHRSVLWLRADVILAARGLVFIEAHDVLVDAGEDGVGDPEAKVPEFDAQGTVPLRMTSRLTVALLVVIALLLAGILLRIPTRDYSPMLYDICKAAAPTDQPGRLPVAHCRN